MSPARLPTDRLLDRLRAVGIADSLGRRLTIVRDVGAGGMGRVFEATDDGSGRTLAVKIIQDARDEADAARFTSEAEILESLDDPAIVAYVGHGTTVDGDPYLAMAWLDGEDLRARLARGPLSVDETLALGRRLAGGLATAHRAGVIHRDLKPSNVVLVDREPARATLVDFGIARRSPVAGDDPLTRTGDLLGTPGYMAPEQVRGRRDLDGRADLFALGCVLYHCLVGAAPFAADEVMTVLAKLLLEEPPALRTVRPDVPSGLARLITRLLAKDPAQRPADAGEVAAALDRMIDAVARGDDDLAGEEIDEVPVSRRRRALGAALTAAAVAAGAVGWAVMPTGQRTDAATVCDPGSRVGCAARCAAGETEACFLVGEGKALGVGGLPRDTLGAVEVIDRTIKSLAHDDTVIRIWMNHVRPISGSFDWSFSLNARGYHVYLAEKAHAEADGNRYRRAEIERALSWFNLASAENGSYHLAIWNRACMSALLGDVAAATDGLRALFAVMPIGEETSYRERICTDTDFCVIDQEPAFRSYLGGVLDCRESPRRCPGGARAIRVP